jgi:hypothetical protein
MNHATKARKNAAQNQHYDPKFILRHFLAVEDKGQVSVFDSQTGKDFQASIASIMAERRFNAFQFDDDWRVSFELAAGKIEEQVLAADGCRELQAAAFEDASEDRKSTALPGPFARSSFPFEITKYFPSGTSERGKHNFHCAGFAAVTMRSARRENALNALALAAASRSARRSMTGQ